MKNCPFTFSLFFAERIILRFWKLRLLMLTVRTLVVLSSSLNIIGIINVSSADRLVSRLADRPSEKFLFFSARASCRSARAFAVHAFTPPDVDNSFSLHELTLAIEFSARGRTAKEVDAVGGVLVIETNLILFERHLQMITLTTLNCSNQNQCISVCLSMRFQRFHRPPFSLWRPASILHFRLLPNSYYHFQSQVPLKFEFDSPSRRKVHGSG